MAGPRPRKGIFQVKRHVREGDLQGCPRGAYARSAWLGREAEGERTGAGNPDANANIHMEILWRTNLIVRPCDEIKVVPWRKSSN